MNKLLTNGETRNAYLFKEKVFNLLTYLLVIIVVFSGVWRVWNFFDEKQDVSKKISLDFRHVREVVLSSEADEARPHNPDCRIWDCLNLYKCGHDRLTVYVYPLQDFVDASGTVATTLTREYIQILEAVVHSPYYTSNPNEACLYLPSLDLLNQNLVEPLLVNRALAALDYWDDGESHILFNLIPAGIVPLNKSLEIHSDRALIMGGSFNANTYRVGFDVSFPVWSPSLHNFDATQIVAETPRKHMLIVAQMNIIPEQMLLLKSLARDNPSQILLLQKCANTAYNGWENLRCGTELHQHKHHYKYPALLAKGTFCLLGRSLRLGQPDLLEMLAHNCIPVIAIDNYILPFEDVLDWTLATIRIRESELHSIVEQLNEVSAMKAFELQEHGKWMFNRYFKNLNTITITAFEILEDRIFPHRARSIRQWNTIESNYRSVINPLFLPIIAVKSQGFTAVILTYDRVESLFALIQKLAVVPSLQNILVVWNNQKKLPPHLSAYPAISKPIKVVQTQANKLSNRFYPYAEIETEAILTIDDDIIMLTADELDFGFEVWREFPDRIVGFPSRVHVWNNNTMHWHYESEWTNQISMVLTGAAFHHKFWSHMYTYAMPGDIKDWVDDHMNCEDIAMNFLVANITNKPPIKVTPRKKFKCPECTNTEMLSADLNHMRERSACIDRFARIYGRMPLRTVEFRADPVLFKDNFPDKLKRFNDIGSL